MAPVYRTLIPLFDELRGERVVVRPYREDDAEALQEAVAESREHLRPWLLFADAHQTVEESRDLILHFMAKWLLRDDMITSLWDAQTGRYVGGSGLHPRGWEIPAFEIGYWLRASAEGKGYMTEAVKLQTDYAFDALGAKRVMIRCDARNIRSAAVPERLGFVHEATLRNDSIATDGAIRSTLIYALTDTDPRWPSARG